MIVTLLVTGSRTLEQFATGGGLSWEDLSVTVTRKAWLTGAAANGVAAVAEIRANASAPCRRSDGRCRRLFPPRVKRASRAATSVNHRLVGDRQRANVGARAGRARAVTRLASDHVTGDRESLVGTRTRRSRGGQREGVGEADDGT